MKTIKQVADDLGISKVAVYKRIDSHGLRERLIKNGNAYYIDEELEKEIATLCKDATSRTAEPKPKPIKESAQATAEVLDMLSDSLKSKDAQIESLNEQIRNLQDQNNKLIDTIREMNLVQANTLKMLQAPAEPEPIEMDAEVTVESPEPVRGIFSRLFSKR